MSDSSNKIPTNEQVIEEITEDLESSLCNETKSDQIGLKKEASYSDAKMDAHNTDSQHTVKLDKQDTSCSSEKEDKGRENVAVAHSDVVRECDEVTAGAGKCDEVTAGAGKCDEADGSEDSEKECEREKKTVPDEEYIDEEMLKEVEEKLSLEEKESRKTEAQKLKSKGNEQFKGDEFREAIRSYTEALRLCPLCYAKERSIMYSNRAASRMKLGFVEPAIEDCSQAIALNPEYLKAILRRANLYEQSEKLDEALQDYQKVLQLDPLHREAMYATKRLPGQIHERNEKLKTEMISKLKDFGNTILKPFGLSTDNFNLKQDPSTGGYSISFQQNTKKP